MADNLPIEVRGWDSYQVHKGSVLVLLYLTPPNTRGWDQKAYAQLIALDSLAEANASTAGTAYPNVTLLTSHPYARISDNVWQATVVVARDGIVGELVPGTISAGPDAEPINLFTLSAVQLWRDGASWVRNLAVTAENALDPAVNAINSVTATVQSVSDKVKVPDTPKLPSLPSVGMLLIVGGVFAGVVYIASRRGLGHLI